MFSCFVPIILPIGFFHFAFKYFVDKHNLCLVCPKDFDSNGKLLQTALQYVVGCVVIFQLTVARLAFSHLSLMFESFFLLRRDWIFAGVVTGEIFLTAVIYFCISYRRKKFLKKKTRRIEQIYSDASTVEAQV